MISWFDKGCHRKGKGGLVIVKILNHTYFIPSFITRDYYDCAKLEFMITIIIVLKTILV